MILSELSELIRDLWQYKEFGIIGAIAVALFLLAQRKAHEYIHDDDKLMLFRVISIFLLIVVSVLVYNYTKKLKDHPNTDDNSGPAMIDSVTVRKDSIPPPPPLVVIDTNRLDCSFMRGTWEVVSPLSYEDEEIKFTCNTNYNYKEEKIPQFKIKMESLGSSYKFNLIPTSRYTISDFVSTDMEKSTSLSFERKGSQMIGYLRQTYTRMYPPPTEKVTSIDTLVLTKKY